MTFVVRTFPGSSEIVGHSFSSCGALRIWALRCLVTLTFDLEMPLWVRVRLLPSLKTSLLFINPLDSKAIIVPHQIIRSWYTGRWWVGCYIWYSEKGPGRAAAQPSPLLAVPNVTAHPSTASVPITVLLYNGSLICGFHVAIKARPQMRWLYAMATSFCLSVRLFVCLSVRSYFCYLWNMLNHSPRGSTWRRAGAFRIVSDTLVNCCTFWGYICYSKCWKSVISLNHQKFR